MQPLTEQQGSRIWAIVNARAPNTFGPCPGCGTRLWQLNDHFFDFLEHDPDPTAGRSTVHFPVVVFTCRNCGYTRMLSAVLLGFMNAQGVLTID